MRAASPSSRRRLARLCLWLAVTSLVLATARPSIEIDPPRRPGILELVVDTSGSTAAGDITPTRFAAIQQVTTALLDQIPANLRVGLVSFSTEATTLADPTTDRDLIRRKIRSQHPTGGTAMGDALQRALDDIRATRPAAPAAILLLSDGANANGRDPRRSAQALAAQHVPILAIAVGTPDGVLHPPAALKTLRPQRVPPDPAQLANIAGLTGGRIIEARSAADLQGAVHSLLGGAGLLTARQDLTMLLVAAALLLLALGAVLSRPRRPAPGLRWRPLSTLRHWAPPAALLLAAGGIAAAWVLWQPTSSPTATAEPSPAIARQAQHTPPVPPGPPPGSPQPPDSVTIDPATSRDRQIVEQATVLLQRHRELAEQRRAEVGALSRSVPLDLTLCEQCKTGSLSSRPPSYILGGDKCAVTLHMPVLKRQARRARLPVRELTAMAVLREQEGCLRHNGGTLAAFTAERRLARKLRHPQLFDLIFAEVDAGTRDWRTLQQAVAIARDHGELAPQRWKQLRQRQLNQVGPLSIDVCRSCLRDAMGHASTGRLTDGAVGCAIKLDIARIEDTARTWALPLTRVVATLLVHEQEHCIRDPDDRETPAIDQERRLAEKLSDSRLIEYVTSRYDDLDRSGHWKD